jgi:hypothetical protein
MDLPSSFLEEGIFLLCGDNFLVEKGIGRLFKVGLQDLPFQKSCLSCWQPAFYLRSGMKSLPPSDFCRQVRGPSSHDFEGFSNLRDQNVGFAGQNGLA